MNYNEELIKCSCGNERVRKKKYSAFPTTCNSCSDEFDRRLGIERVEVPSLPLLPKTLEEQERMESEGVRFY